MRFTQLLRYGVYAGAAAGACSALVLWLVVEPVIRRALAVEEARGGHHHGEEPLVTRGQQVVAGGVTAVLVGVMVGVVFAVVYARSQHRLPGTTAVGRGMTLAALGFGVVTLLPALELPANPPGVGAPGTVGERTLLYLLTILLGLLLVVLVHRLEGGLRSREVSPGRRTALTTATAAVGVALVLAAVPGDPGPVPPDVPADLLWDFRVASLGQLATTWLVLGVVFGLLVDPRSRAHAAAEPAAV